MVDKRQDQIFDIIVQCYIETAEPVGSRTISKRSRLGLSPASIRNVMADLEEEGLLRQPHTSAGRVPTDRGYRYWVDSLMRREDLTPDEKDHVKRQISRERTLEGLVEKVSKLISELTENAAVVFLKSYRRASFLPEELGRLEAARLEEYWEEQAGLFVEGLFRMFDYPEFRDPDKIRQLLQAFGDKEEFLSILEHDLESRGTTLHIGSENAPELGDVSIVVHHWHAGGTPVGGVAAVGPTRMRYPKVVSVVEYVADTVSDAVRRI